MKFHYRNSSSGYALCVCGLPGHSLHVCDLFGVAVTCVALIVRAWPVWAFLQYCGLEGASETLWLHPCKPCRYKLEAVVLIKSGYYIVPSPSTTLFLPEIKYCVG